MKTYKVTLVNKTYKSIVVMAKDGVEAANEVLTEDLEKQGWEFANIEVIR